MPTVRSSVAIIGHPKPEQVQFGAEFYLSFKEFKNSVQTAFFPVVVVSLQEILHMPVTERTACARSILDEFVQFIGVGQDSELLELIRQAPDFQCARILAHYDDSHFDYYIQEALERYTQLRQEKELSELYDQQNRRLLALSQDLESRVQSRQHTLEVAQTKASNATKRYVALQRALIAVLGAHSIPEMERRLRAAISTVMEVTWVRIVFSQQSSWRPDQSSPNFSMLCLPLKREMEELGSVFFGRKSGRPFKQFEEDFLERVCEAVAFSVERLIQLELSESLKTQWDTAFNSIRTPVLIVNDTYDVIRANKAWNEGSQTAEPKCYEQFFGRTRPCTHCHLGQNFQAERADKTFHVLSKPVTLPDEARATFVNLYQDITPRLEMERTLLESAKSVELGLVGGSIAHELNNPLGGIMMFLSLIQQDTPRDAEFAPEITEMERAAQKCKSIVENMLAFARQEEASERAWISLSEAVRRATTLLELKTRSAGIEIQFEPVPNEARIFVGPNATVQALVNLLQSSLERISSRTKSESTAFGHPRITISARPTASGWTLSLIDNGIASVEGARGTVVGLTVAQHILRDQNASIRIMPESETQTRTEIEWKNP